MISIYRKEISAYFNGLTGYLTVGLFLLVTGLLLWVFADTAIPDAGYASLDSFFYLAPYIFMFLVPAITMHSIAGEKASGTFELIMTRPITLKGFLAGKFLSSLTIVVIALLPTLVYYFSVYMLGASTGNVDTGAVIGSYIGLLLLSASFVAIGIFTSALSPNPVVAFLMAVFLCFFCYYAFRPLGELPIFGSLGYVITLLGMDMHYQAVSRGVLDMRDLLYFLSVVFVFLLWAFLSMRRNRAFGKTDILEIACVLMLIFLSNYITVLYSWRLDFTAEKRYTLSPVSRQSVEHLAEDLHVTVFLTGELPAGFRKLNSAVNDLLIDLNGYSGGRLKFSFVNPAEGNAAEQAASIQALAAKGIEPTNLNIRNDDGVTEKLIFPAALLSFGETEVAVNLLQNRLGVQPDEILNNSIQNLEYAFTSAIRKATASGKPLVGFTEGHGELSDTALYDLMSGLGDGYLVGRVDLNTFTFDGLRNLSVLVVPKPMHPFKESEKYKLDYFVQHGGSILWAIDQTDASLDSMRHSGEQLVMANRLNLDDMLFKFGVRFNYNLIEDMNCAQIPLTLGGVSENAQLQLVPWLYYPVFMPMSVHSLLKNLDGIRSEFSGTLDTIAVPAVRKTILLSSSPYNHVDEVPALVSLQLAGKEPDPEQMKASPRPVAALLEGTFPSVFVNRPLPEGTPDTVKMPEMTKPARMIFIADGDVLKNQVNQQDGSPFPLGWDRYTGRQYGNKVFLRNAVDYLAGDSAIISLREKEIKLRVLDRVKVKTEKLKWQLINVGLPPFLLFLAGFTQQIIRRRRYGTKLS